MKVNKFFFILLIYFFFNSFGLPEGLLYTTLLVPFFLLWLRGKNKKRPILQFLLYSSPFILIHFVLGVQFFSFLKSYILLFSSYLFTYTFYVYLKEKKDLGPFFKEILILNFFACVLALLIYFTPWKEVLWTVRNLTLNIRDFPRMQLLTYEPSYYATLFVPIALYYIFKLFLNKQTFYSASPYLVFVGLPLILSFSLGVIATLIITLLLTVLIFQKQFFKKRTLFYSISSLSILIVISFFLLLLFFPDNPLFSRIFDLVTGQDISAKGRTTHAIKMASLVAETKSLFFGVGVGQIKIMGDEVVRNYYNYHASQVPIIRIPSSIGETIGSFGYVGLALRLFFEFYLFYKTKVIKNYYRTAIFVYIFIYQFTGSFLTNIAEYVLWVIAFTPAFFQFDLNKGSE